MVAKAGRQKIQTVSGHKKEGVCMFQCENKNGFYIDVDIQEGLK